MYTHKKSNSCNSKEGKPLQEYPNITEAKHSADYVKKEYGNDVVPYKCGQCNKYHLSSKNRMTPKTYCQFCGKSLYDSKESAKLRKDIIFKEKGKILKVYKCLHRNGWHLTSKS